MFLHRRFVKRGRTIHLRQSLRRRDAGAVMVYLIVSLFALIAIASLAVDYGHVQVVKTELERLADSTARGNLVIYQVYGQSTANTYGTMMAGQDYNPVDSASGLAPTITITWGSWNTATQTFTPGSGTPMAVRVVASRTKANNNAVPLTLAAVLGRKSCDVSATSIACMVGTSSANISTPASSDPWLAGMPSGATASYDDTAPGQSPTQVTSIPVIPGSYITLTNVSGTAQHATTGTADGPEGNLSQIYSHGIDSPGGPTPAAENGIADAVMPIDAFLGVFLDASAPNTSPAPARRDYTSAAARDQATYDDIALKQPFFIGDGKTSSGTVQQFRVPPGATRLYLGVMDGYEWKNNSGTFSATITVLQTISTVQ